MSSRADAILTLNAGSSSLKFSVFAVGTPPELKFRGQVEALFTRPRFVASDSSGQPFAEFTWPAATQLGHAGAIDYLFARWREVLSDVTIVAAGHRVVHGGREFTRPVIVDDVVMADLQRLVPLAPLHQPHNLRAIEAVAQHAPELPQVACFDTSFHRTQPPLAQAFALPRRFTDAGIIRYGFHGLSYEYIASVLPSVDTRAAEGRTVVAHLGSGISMCALRSGQSIATTMGFTPLDGLPMGTRCGAIDPGVLLYLMDHDRMDARSLEKLLYRESGLIGVSGISNDMRTLEASCDPRAAEAIDLLVYRIGRELGSLVAALGGIDALVFTGGIGENSGAIRARICRDADWLGLQLDFDANDAGCPRISRPHSHVTAWVIPTNEELMIAEHTQCVLRERPASFADGEEIRTSFGRRSNLDA